MKFLPLLLIYILVVLIFSSPTLEGDQARYVMFADNLSHGFYSSPAQRGIHLWNGPGYPIILVPFVVLKLPWLSAKLLNALFLFGTVLYFYRTLRLYIQEHHAVFFSYLLGIYPPIMRDVYLLLTEPLTFFLISCFSYYFCKLYKDNRDKWTSLLPPIILLGYLALTKIIFGYVILAELLLFLFMYLWKRRSIFKKTLLICLFALIFCSPYLFYTYSLTGKIFYWGSSGGIALYWLSTPYQDELGDLIQEKGELYEIQQAKKNHGDFYKKIAKLDNIQRDDEFKKQAIYNIKHYPFKFFKNWIANIGRLLFNYPYSYYPQHLGTFFYIIPNMFIVVLSILCIYPTYIGRKLIPHEIYALLLFGVIAFVGNSLLSAIVRYFYVLVPFFALWIFFTLGRILRIEINKEEKSL